MRMTKSVILSQKLIYFPVKADRTPNEYAVMRIP